MFGKLKDKLKQSLSIFSKKAEEEAVEEVVENPVQEVKEEKAEKTEEKVVDKISDKPKKEKLEKKKEKSEEPIVEKQEEKTKEIILEKEDKKDQKTSGKKTVEKETKQEKPKEKSKELILEKEEPAKEAKEETKEPETKPEVKEEKKGFFGRIKDTFSKQKEKQKENVETTENKSETQKKVETVKEETKPTKEIKIEKEEEKVIQPIETDVKEEEPKQEEIIEKPEIEETVKPEAQEEKKGFFGKIKQSLTTKTISSEKFSDLFWDIEMVLLENNVSVAVIEKIKSDLEQELVNKPLPRDVESKIMETLKNTLSEILTFEKVDLVNQIKQKSEKPYVVAFFGINGAGKTTSIAKLTHYLKQNNLSVVLAACDTFRAAAIQQLEEHANKLEVKMIKHEYGSDAAAVAFDAIKYAEKNKVDIVLIDTAGRLHSNTNLMAELEKIIRVTKPDLKIFVGESITGNDCIEQAEKFNSLVEMDGAILTKADVDEKGGAPLSISYVIKKPILFLGVGQNYEDFEEFDKDVILGRLGL